MFYNALTRKQHFPTNTSLTLGFDVYNNHKRCKEGQASWKQRNEQSRTEMIRVLSQSY